MGHQVSCDLTNDSGRSTLKWGRGHLATGGGVGRDGRGQSIRPKAGQRVEVGGVGRRVRSALRAGPKQRCQEFEKREKVQNFHSETKGVNGPGRYS